MVGLVAPLRYLVLRMGIRYPLLPPSMSRQNRYCITRTKQSTPPDREYSEARLVGYQMGLASCLRGVAPGISRMLLQTDRQWHNNGHRNESKSNILSYFAC